MNSLGTSDGTILTETLVDATAVAVTSKGVNCEGARAIMLVFSSVAVGETQDRKMTLTVEVNNDDSTTYHAYSMLLSNTANTNGETLTRVASQAIDAAAVESHVLWLTPETLGAITHFRVKLARNTAGTAGTFTVKSSVLT